MSSCQWIKDRLNLIILGPTGTGKSYLACALAQKACREGYSSLYTRTSRLCQDLYQASNNGTYDKTVSNLAKIDLLVLDDWCLYKFNDRQCHDILEIMEDRHNLRATVIVSQLPIDHWHDIIGAPILADAILDRMVHNAYKINLSGESMRKNNSKDLT